MEMKGENMKFPKRLLAWMLSLVMVFGLAGTMAFANEAATEVVSDEYIDVALDRSMLDDYSLYVYLSDATAE